MLSQTASLVAAVVVLAQTTQTSDAAAISTNSPQLSWTTRVNPRCMGLSNAARPPAQTSSTSLALRARSGVFAYRVAVAAPGVAPEWDSGWVFAENEPFPGLYIYDGPPLLRGVTYNWTASELQWQPYPPIPGPYPTAPWVAGTGAFVVSPDLLSPEAEAVAELNGPGNFSTLAANALASVTGRVQPSGFVPTSISGGYGGSTQMFVRDTCAMLLGLLEAQGATALPTVGRVLNFTLSAIEAAGVDYAPHVMTADAGLDRIVALDMADQTDGTMHLAVTVARFLELGGDPALGRAFYPTVRRLLNHYAAPHAANVGGVPYFNATLGLLFNPNLEHSRLGHYWSTFDVLTNTFAAEALRQMAGVAAAMGDGAQATAWAALRTAVVAGVAESLGYATANETSGAPIYGELIGGVHYWWPGSNNAYPPGNSTGPLVGIYGMSWVNTAVAGAFSAVLGAPRVSPAVAGLDVPRLVNTLDTARRLGSFLWLTDDPAGSALVSLTHLNASTHTDPDRAVIGKGFGWELAAAAYTGRWARVATLARWLGAAAANLTLFGESYEYDCLRAHETIGCWGDMGNGEQTGWFVWGVAVARSLAAAAAGGVAGA